MPVMVEFSAVTDDKWIRDAIKGSTQVPPLERVIVQGTDEADRIVRELANLKTKRRLTYGGSIHRRATDVEIRQLIATGFNGHSDVRISDRD